MLKDRFPSILLFLVKPEIKVLMERLSFIDEIICYKKGMPIFPVLKKYGNLMSPFAWMKGIEVLCYLFCMYT